MRTRSRIKYSSWDARDFHGCCNWSKCFCYHNDKFVEKRRRKRVNNTPSLLDYISYMTWAWKGICKFICLFISMHVGMGKEWSSKLVRGKLGWHRQTLPLFLLYKFTQIDFSIFSTPISWYSSSFSDLEDCWHTYLILFDFTRSRSTTTSDCSLTLVTHFFLK